MLYHNLTKFGDHRYFSSRDMFLVCHVIKQGHIIKGLDGYKDRSPSKEVTILSSLVAIFTLVLKI